MRDAILFTTEEADMLKSRLGNHAELGYDDTMPGCFTQSAYHQNDHAPELPASWGYEGHASPSDVPVQIASSSTSAYSNQGREAPNSREETSDHRLRFGASKPNLEAIPLISMEEIDSIHNLARRRAGATEPWKLTEEPDPEFIATRLRKSSHIRRSYVILYSYGLLAAAMKGQPRARKPSFYDAVKQKISSVTGSIRKRA
jgi:hypothetical protein